MELRWKKGTLARLLVERRNALWWLAVVVFLAASVVTALGTPVLLVAAMGLYLAYDAFIAKRTGAIAVPWQVLNVLASKQARRNYLLGEAVASRIPHVNPQGVLSDRDGFLLLADDIPLELIGRGLRSLLQNRARLRRAVAPRPTLVNHTLGSMLVLALLMTGLSFGGPLALWGLPVAVVLAKLVGRRASRAAVNLLLLYTRFPALIVKTISTVQPREHLGYPVSPLLLGCWVELRLVREEARVGWLGRFLGRAKRPPQEASPEAVLAPPSAGLASSPAPSLPEQPAQPEADRPDSHPLVQTPGPGPAEGGGETP